jgi:hypothetical protein
MVGVLLDLDNKAAELANVFKSRLVREGIKRLQFVVV